jgi:hypothetical protein
MTLEEKIQQRRIALAMRNRQATGIVVDVISYRELYSEQNHSSGKFIPDHFNVLKSNDGDTYMGLDVAITKKPNTLIVY